MARTTARTTVTRVDDLPGNPAIQAGFGTVDYRDSYRVTRATDEDAGQIMTRLFTLPGWALALMNLRNRVVKPFGLKTGTAALFTVLRRDENEMLVEALDRHLDCRISVWIDRENARVYLTTLVHYNNRLGKLYFSLVKPFHGMIARSIMKRLARETGNAGKTPASEMKNAPG